jgi:hypothetical protein
VTGVLSGLAAARRVADAVLYEGYLLYPYRATAAKNRVRWQFGVLSPDGAAAAGVGERPAMSAEVLLRPAPAARLAVHVRFLQVQARTVQAPARAAVSGAAELGAAVSGAAASGAAGVAGAGVAGAGVAGAGVAGVGSAADGYADVASLPVAGVVWVPWDEAVAREVVVDGLTADDLLRGRRVPIAVDGGVDVEPLIDGGAPVGRLVRTRWPVTAELTLAASTVDGWLRLRVNLRNLADWRPGETTRDLAARRALVGTHLLLAGDGAGFVSLADPPAGAVAAAAGCRNAGWWPALVGGTVLVAPIILPDQAEIAPESPGDMFDATEIDEILTLRVMTLTDEEKAAARGTDPRAAAIIDRCDSMPAEVLERLHGARREPPSAPDRPVWTAVPTYAEPDPDGPDRGGPEPAVPWWDPGADASASPETDTVLVGGVPVAKGSRVRLRPSRHADAQDMFLAGQVAVVTAVLSDVDGGRHVAVVLADDPAADLHDWYGRYWYFGPDEIEPLPAVAT